jgi:hypothetical protein
MLPWILIRAEDESLHYITYKLPPFLDISHIVSGMEIKEHTFRKKYTMFGWD